MLLPRRLTIFVAGLAAGLIAGGIMGYNYSRGLPLFSSPFTRKTIAAKIRRTEGRALEKVGRAIAGGGRDLKKILDKHRP